MHDEIQDSQALRQLRKALLYVQGQAEILLGKVRKGAREENVVAMKKDDWTRQEKIFIHLTVAVLIMLFISVCFGWMDVAHRLEQKYVCPCFNYYKNGATGYYEAVRVVACRCSDIDIQDAKACSPISDTICRNVSNDRLVCDELVMVGKARS